MNQQEKILRMVETINDQKALIFKLNRKLNKTILALRHLHKLLEHKVNWGPDNPELGFLGLDAYRSIGKELEECV
jgi:hypothetical protein